MKRHTTYPTTHPHWIDDDENPAGEKSRFGITFTTAFAIVLGLHVAVIGGIYATSRVKPMKTVVTKTEAKPEAGPSSDALARNEWPEPEAQPKVVATPPPAAKQLAAATPVPKPRPAVAKSEKATPVQQKAPVVATAPSKEPSVIAKAAAKTLVPNAESEALKKAFLAAKGNAAVEQQRGSAASAQAVAAPEVAASVAMSPQGASAGVDAAPVPAPPRPERYTLAPGDNLYMVSRRLQVSYNDLMEANNLSDPRQLRVGQTLVVPEG